jgi:hypothetical protein
MGHGSGFWAAIHQKDSRLAMDIGRSAIPLSNDKN